MEKATLTKVFRKQQKTKYGDKPMISIQTAERGAVWISTFKVDGTDSWKEGDVVQIKVTQSGNYLNFEPQASPGDIIKSLTVRVKRLEDKIFGEQLEAIPPKQQDPPQPNQPPLMDVPPPDDYPYL